MLLGCRSVTGSVPQLLWMSTELLVIARVYHRQVVMSILLSLSSYGYFEIFSFDHGVALKIDPKIMLIIQIYLFQIDAARIA